jgi:acetyl esterase/lipase
VISVDYWEGPEHRFPAASEDVTAVYQELLKSYPPQNIGIYGCSAGGMLTTMSVAWFKLHGLPRSGAVGILCAGATPVTSGFGGDASYAALPLGEGRVQHASPSLSNESPLSLEYLRGTDPKDPLVAPVFSREVLAWFPPTLLVTGTHGFEFSATVFTHEQMVKASVDAELHVWEGMFHGFFYNPDVPESKDCVDVIVGFFQRKLGTVAPPHQGV